MGGRKLCRQLRRHHSNEVVCPRCSAMEQESPTRLHVRNQRYAVQRRLLVFAHVLQLVMDKIWVPERRSQDLDPLRNRACLVASSPDPGTFHDQLGSSLQEIACLWPTGPVPHLRFSSVHLDAGVPPEYVVQEGKEQFSCSQLSVHCFQAGCWPRANKSGIIASPCSPPSPW